jgi:hypothetical protein
MARKTSARKSLGRHEPPKAKPGRRSAFEHAADLVFVDIDPDDPVPEFRQAGCRHAADVTQSEDRNMGCFRHKTSMPWKLVSAAG